MLFIQVIRGRAADADGLRSQMQTWMQDIGKGAEGWLGATGGVTDDGEAVVVVRFESEDAARSNSDRPEQGEWWTQTEKHFDGPVTFQDCAVALEWGKGGSDDAGFVQVIRGRTSDEDRMRALSEQFGQVTDRRPDVIGGTIGFDGSGGFNQTVYFTSEEEARAGEAQMSEDVPEDMQEWMSLVQGDLEYLDLKDPWLYSR